MTTEPKAEECNFYVDWVEFARTLELELQRKTAALEDISKCNSLPYAWSVADKALREQPGAGA